MPNWVEGIFRARGTKERMLNFIQNQLMTAYDKPPEIIGDKYEDGDIYFTFSSEEDDFKKNIYINGIVRGYLVYESVPYLQKINNNSNEYIMVEKFKRAWDLNLGEIEELAKKYRIDIKINVYEQGLQFSKLYEVDRTGYVVHREEKKYNDYNWECPMPLLGG